MNGNKDNMPAIKDIVTAIQERGFFAGIKRFQYVHYDIEQALKVIEAIGKARNSKFVIDDENRFTYENFIKWCHCDTSMKCLDPITQQIIPGRLKRGIYIAGNTGSGKSWCLEIMRAYCSAFGFQVQMDDDIKQSLCWKTIHANTLCDVFIETGTIQQYKKQPLLAIQDFGCEPKEMMYMGNRFDVMRQLIEYRGDKDNQITLLTSNYKLQGKALDERYGDKVASRLVEMCNYFEIKGKDRRKF